jgi:hypothetical protein
MPLFFAGYKMKNKKINLLVIYWFAIDSNVKKDVKKNTRSQFLFFFVKKRRQ